MQIDATRTTLLKFCIWTQKQNMGVWSPKSLMHFGGIFFIKNEFYTYFFRSAYYCD